MFSGKRAARNKGFIFIVFHEIEKVIHQYTNMPEEIFFKSCILAAHYMLSLPYYTLSYFNILFLP